jgi:hypothetical protein
MKSTFFSVATPCSSEGAQHFGGANQRKKQHWEAENSATLPPDSTDFLLGLLSDPEDGSDMFLRNVGLSPNYMAL